MEMKIYGLEFMDLELKVKNIRLGLRLERCSFVLVLLSRSLPDAVLPPMRKTCFASFFIEAHRTRIVTNIGLTLSTLTKCKWVSPINHSKLSPWTSNGGYLIQSKLTCALIWISHKIGCPEKNLTRKTIPISFRLDRKKTRPRIHATQLETDLWQIRKSLLRI